MLFPITAGTQINDLLGRFGLPGGLAGAYLDGLSGNPLGALINLKDAFDEVLRGAGTTGAERRASQSCPHAHPARPSAAIAKCAALCGAGYAPGFGGPSPLAIAAGLAAAGTVGRPAALAGPALLSSMVPSVGVKTLALGGLAGLMGGGFGFGMLGGAGVGSFNPNAAPGRINNTNPLYERAHQAQVAGVLQDPSLTVEDKVTLMLMLIMKKMDRDIERQTQYVNSIQQQQSNREKAGQGLSLLGTAGGAVVGSIVPGLGTAVGSKLGGALGGAAGQMAQGGNSPSIDVETMKMKRMIDKRSQMFDMLRQIIDKYNETAKGVIQSIGR